MGTKRIKSTAMTDQHLCSPGLPDFDAPTIHRGMNARVTELRRGCARPADTGHQVEAR
ncbi:hypothetical protein GGQ68_004375 [Sagittula marina]|uniref:Uncharacterized protein n=1 Tax=Sagittula marina TaxID=943940 RepID=A0A7W6GTX6_9RHOB|nr:hypothetical protein [Sagittula marina]